MLADTQLIGLILVLLLMDTIVIGLWIALDPLKRHLYNLPMVVSPEDRSVVYQPQVAGASFLLAFHVLFMRRVDC